MIHIPVRKWLSNIDVIVSPKTNRMQANIQASMAVKPSALGVLVVTVLKILTNTRKRVTSRAIRPKIELADRLFPSKITEYQ